MMDVYKVGNLEFSVDQDLIEQLNKLYLLNKKEAGLSDNITTHRIGTADLCLAISSAVTKEFEVPENSKVKVDEQFINRVFTDFTVEPDVIGEEFDENSEDDGLVIPSFAYKSVNIKAFEEELTRKD